MKVERNRVWNKYTFTPEDKEDEKFLDKVNKKIDELEKENKKLKEDNRFLTKISKEYMKKENVIEVTEFTELYKDDLEKDNKELKEKLALTENDRDEREVKARDMMKENKELKYKINKFLRLYKKWHSDSLFDYVETLSYERY